MQKNELQNHIGTLLAMAMQKCDNLSDAQDLTQETLLAALTFCQKGGTINDAHAWLSAVMNRKFYDLLRQKYRMPSITIGEDFDLEDNQDYVSDIIRREESEAVRREVAYLSETYRIIIAEYYFYGKSVAEISQALALPEGTIKSRLNSGRQKIKKGLKKMENYSENSYMPQRLIVRNSGECGLNEEPMSLASEDDLLSQNLLILAYNKPADISELSKAIGIPAAYVEPVVNKLVSGELMKRMGDGKVYTDFIIYHAEDYVKYIREQEQFASDYADAYCTPMEQAIKKLQQTDFYSKRLERYMLIHIADHALYQSVQAYRKPQLFPCRPNGGRWVAFGTIYPQNYTIPKAKQGKEEYLMSGPRRTRLEQYLNASGLELFNYETSLYPYPKYDGYGYQTLLEAENNMLKLFYLICKNIAPETVDTDPKILKAIPLLRERGFLTADNGKLELLIPRLTHAQAALFRQICGEASSNAARLLEKPMAEYIRTHTKKIPPHLKSVPDQKLTMPYEPGAMMLVYEAIGRGLHPRDLGGPCPETFVVFD